MKKFQFLLLDAGPIIKLFQLGVWGEFIEKCHATIACTVVEQCIHKGGGDALDYIDFPFEEADVKGLIKIVEVEPSEVKAFYDESHVEGRYIIDGGEQETLAFVHRQSEDWKVCSTDRAVYSVLGFLGKGELGVSLEEILKEVGLSKGKLEWKYTRKFREKFTRKGEVDAVQS
ncbi:MAG: hypothetical protein JSV99_07290 [Planctomycetota bacterium]|nr:MAG: hypothetical protein JSV99_07290 [Planctomycetota bacterium]